MISDIHRKASCTLVTATALCLGTGLRAQTNSFPASGSVGIGTTSPSTTLEVAANPSSTAPQVRVSPIGYTGSSTSLPSYLDFFSTFDDYPTDQGPRRTATIKAQFAGGVWGNEALIFEVGSGGASDDSGNELIERVRIAGNGNVGIGTTSPSNTLTIQQMNDSQGAGGLRLYSHAGGDSGATLIQGSDHNTYLFNMGGGATGNGILFYVNGMTDAMNITSSGNVGIGTTNPQHLLHVAGSIGAEEVIVSATGADYVFQPDYHLSSLDEVNAYIKENHHLPDVPSAAEMQTKGLSLGEMQTKLLAKVEELTLHMIQVEQENRELKERIKKLELADDGLASRAK